MANFTRFVFVFALLPQCVWGQSNYAQSNAAIQKRLDQQLQILSGLKVASTGFTHTLRSHERSLNDLYQQVNEQSISFEASKSRLDRLEREIKDLSDRLESERTARLAAERRMQQELDRRQNFDRQTTYPKRPAAQRDIYSNAWSLYQQTGDPIFYRLATDPYFAGQVANNPALLGRVYQYYRP